MNAALQIPPPPQALTLVFQGKTDPVAYACPTCGVIWSPAIYACETTKAHRVAKEGAAHHCHNYCDCGRPTERGWTICSVCRVERETEREAKKFELATKIHQVDDAGDPVFWDGHSGSLGDGFFSSVDEVIDYCEDADIEPPAYVWACTPSALSIDVEDVLERIFSEHHEDARDGLEAGAEKELSTFLKAWCEKQKIQSWHTDYSRVILLDALPTP